MNDLYTYTRVCDVSCEIVMADRPGRYVREKYFGLNQGSQLAKSS